jgi:phage tail-like protein
MAEPGERHDPYLTFRFAVKLDDFDLAGGFSECTGLALEVEVQDYPEGGLNTFVHKLPGRTKQTNITLKHGIIDRSVWQWFYETSQGQITLRNGSIVVYDAAGKSPVMTWNFSEAFPAKWTGPDLNATQNAVATEALELTHQGLERTL